MDIQFRCTSVSHFDEATGTYQQCNQLLQVSSDNIGLKVRCPRCNQTTAIPGRQIATAKDGATETPGSIESGETVAQVEPSLSYGQFNRATRCPKCGSLLDDEKKCTACRYETPLVDVTTVPIESMTVQPAGFQLWFKNIMADGVGADIFEVALHSFLTIVMLGLIVFAIMTGGTASIYVILGALLLGGFYLFLVLQTKRMATVPGTRMPFYLKPFWTSILRLARMQGWTKYDSRLKDRLVIDVRGEAFGDRDLLDLEKLNICEVLDAEGSDITDNSLAAMHGLKYLRCLVIRKTHVTHEAVFRLQQSLPKCWIWY